MSIDSDIAMRSYTHSGEARIAIDTSLTDQISAAPHLMFCGGFHSAMAGTKATAIHDICVQHAWQYTRFDYRGHGVSGGDSATLTLHDWLADTLAVFDDCNTPTLLIGSSMGAWLATLVALRRPELVRGVILLAAAPDFLQELIAPNLSPADIWDLQQGQPVNIPNAYEGSYPITQALLDSGKELSLLDGPALETLRCPVRLLHGSNDQDVPYSLSIRLMDKITHPDATLTLLHQADHRLSDERSLAHIKQILTQIVPQCFSANQDSNSD